MRRTTLVRLSRSLSVTFDCAAEENRCFAELDGHGRGVTISPHSWGRVAEGWRFPSTPPPLRKRHVHGGD